MTKENKTWRAYWRWKRLGIKPRGQDWKEYRICEYLHLHQRFTNNKRHKLADNYYLENKVWKSR